MSSILLDRPSAIRTVPTASASSSVPAASAEPTVITLSVELPAGTSPAQAAAIADALRINADRYAAPRGGRTRVRLGTPVTGQTAQAADRSQAFSDRAISSLRPRRFGAVSPTAPARRDAESARLRLLQSHRGSPVSPVSPAAAPSASGLLLDLYGRRLRINNEDVELTHKEFELLAHLAKHARTVVTREDLMVNVWADSSDSTSERTIDVHVRRLRNKLGAYRRLVSTVRGAGYRLDPGSDVTIIGLA